MTRQEANKIVYEMGWQPYSASAMVDALLKGVEIGKEEQKAIDDKNLAECKRQRDAYYDELTRLRQERVELIDKACKCFCDICGYKECAKINVVCTEYKEFRKAKED